MNIYEKITKTKNKLNTNFSANLINNYIYMFGGTYNGKNSNAFYKLNVKTLEIE